MSSTFNNLIDGECVTGVTVTPNFNPSDISDVTGGYARSERAQTLSVIASAKHAFSAWSNSAIQVRFDILDHVGIELLARKDELGSLLSRKEGKTLPEGIGEVMRAGHIVKFFADECLRLSGDKLPSARPGWRWKSRASPSV